MHWSVVFTWLFISLNTAELINYDPLPCSSCFLPGTLRGCQQNYADFLLADSCETCQRIVQSYIEKLGWEGCYRKMKYDPEQIEFALLAAELHEKFVRNRTAVPSSFLESDANNGSFARLQTKIFQRQRRLFDCKDAVSVPYHAQMVNYTNGSICGGAAVSPYHILTSAHCFHQKNIDGANNMAIYVGGSGEFGDGAVVTINKVYVHPEFKKGDPRFDIALVYTKKMIPTSSIIALASRDAQPGDKGTITGFGTYPEVYEMHKPEDIYPEKLKMADLTIVSIIGIRNFLTNGRVGAGDTGDPLVLERNGEIELIGILKGTESATRVIYPYFVNVWQHRGWINKIMEQSQHTEL